MLKPPWTTTAGSWTFGGLPSSSRVQVQRVRLVYEGGELLPKEPRDLEAAVNEVQGGVPGVEVLVQ